MHYVILRDDDTSALTPVECLEQLYRPFLQRGLPVNLATIPKVRTDTRGPDGSPERYLLGKPADSPSALGLMGNSQLVCFLRQNPGLHLVQHGYDHSLFEFGSHQRADVGSRLELGAHEFAAAGFGAPRTFVAPYDRFSPTSLSEAAKRFRVISAGWFELRRLPFAWWPAYFWKRWRKQPHWRIGQTILLTHPGCLISYKRPYSTIFDNVKRYVEAQRLTVLVNHWWESFREGPPDTPLIAIVHRVADWLASQPQVRVLAFEDLTPDHEALK